MNTVLFFCILVLWFVVLFGIIDKKHYGVLGYPATFGIILILGTLCGIAQKKEEIKEGIDNQSPP